VVFGKRATAANGDKTLLTRLDDVEDRLARIERRYLKLQGELTGAIRYQRQLEEELDERAERESQDVEEVELDEG